MVNDVNKFIMPNGDEVKIDGLYGKITNCLLEVPQRIKLELNDGTLTLKAGSQVIVPNGFETDGTTPKFDEVVIESDTTVYRNFNTGVDVIFVDDNRQISGWDIGAVYSGSSPKPPSDMYQLWYDTANNLMKSTENGGTTWRAGLSFPVAISSRTVNTGFTSIDQIFNGIGYIGSTVFVDKGVKGLIPNGRNADGSLNNIEFETDKVLTRTLDTSTTPFVLGINSTQFTSDNTYFISSEKKPTGYYLWYKPSTNTLYDTTAGIDVTGNCCAILINAHRTNGVIDYFRPKTTFHALDYNDKSEISGWGMPSGKYIDLTLGASGTEYTAPANGWVHLRKACTATNQYIELWVLKSVGPRIYSSDSGQNLSTYVPVIKGKTFGINYTAQGETKSFKFIYAEGSK